MLKTPSSRRGEKQKAAKKPALGGQQTINNTRRRESEDAQRVRFQIELEFVQCLANPNYLLCLQRGFLIGERVCEGSRQQGCWVWSSIHVLNIRSILSISASRNLVTFVAVIGVVDPAISLILSALLTIECTVEGAKPCTPPITDVLSPCSCLFTISNFTSNVTATRDLLATLLGVLVARRLGIARSHKTHASMCEIEASVLAQRGYFKEQTFINYLKYLQYWKEPEYAKYLKYPMCLYFLDLLQHENFRKEIVNGQCCKFIDDQTVLHWQHYSRKQVTQLIKMGDANELPIFLDPLDARFKDYIFLPVNDNSSVIASGGSHWSLLVYSRFDNKWYHYDSQRGANYRDARCLVQRINTYLNRDIPASLIDAHCTQQDNSYDCGAFVMTYAHQTAAQAVQGTALGTCYVDRQEANRMRDLIKSLVYKLRGSGSEQKASVCLGRSVERSGGHMLASQDPGR
ncbi:Mediator of RNA polymerase II transcription subunit 31-like [Homarus americanus]|uniref:Mediator of RNA polymerase II transcription subunit 31-like n=1 Tax=Homarus americanus TaxID=6706 RepID=A0A8J5MQ47_HOMAM|nr:Mediator of RNA polymerase II transcription subunit 31-like [Homarus americanus]